ncbi:MAG TPA: hypothetical protein VD971_02815 [Phycisphaerales bacterium]|nr:hypothetical protein [Phycisphaerales bacterium]
MSTVAVSPVERKPAAFEPSRWFYTFTALVLLVVSVVGFQHFYFQGRAYPGRDIPPPIRTLVIAHGVIMSAWILLFATQPALVAARGRKAHVRLGWFGVALACAVVVSGSMLAVQAMHIAPSEMQIWGMTPKQFLTVPLLSVAVFAGFVAVAVWKRRKPAIHRAMMLAATLAASDAAIARIDPINSLYLGTVCERVFGPFFAMLVLGVLLLAIRCAVTRSFDRWLALAVGVLFVTSALTVGVAHTDAWDAFASSLMR